MLFTIFTSHTIGRDVFRDAASIIARSPDEGNSLAEYANNTIGMLDHAIPGFGGCHTGVAAFLYGDGSVHLLSANTGRDVLLKLADVEGTGDERQLWVQPSKGGPGWFDADNLPY